jgi:Cell division control protein 14, SIN component
MEASLSRSFDYLSSPNPTRIRKGLRQLEGILAQICLSKPVPNKRHSMLALGSAPVVSTKTFEDLRVDHGYREFFNLQQSFQWNITMRLIGCLERLLGRESNGQNDLLVIQALELIHGVLLLHPPSRELFAREIYMNVSESTELLLVPS